MERKIIYPKCPYCHEVMTDKMHSAFAALWGERYVPLNVDFNCPHCGGACKISLAEIHEYSARKARRKEATHV